MSQDSNTIVERMKELISKVQRRYIVVTFGFVRNIDLKDIPDEIINYCVVYAFLRINEWFEAGRQWKIDYKNKYIAYGEPAYSHNKYALFSSIYANPVISNGKHEWKIKITSTDSREKFHDSSSI